MSTIEDQMRMRAGAGQVQQMRQQSQPGGGQQRQLGLYGQQQQRQPGLYDSGGQQRQPGLYGQQQQRQPGLYDGGGQQRQPGLYDSSGAQQRQPGLYDGGGQQRQPGLYGNQMQPGQQQRQQPGYQQSWEQPSVSQRQADYTKYILYVVPGDPNSERAIKAASGMMDVLITNVRQIPKAQRPPWLTSVPYLYAIDVSCGFSGKFCADKLASLGGKSMSMSHENREQLAPIDMGPSFSGSGKLASAAGFSGITESVSKAYVGNFISDVGADDDRYKKDSRQKVNTDELDNYKRNRERTTMGQQSRQPVNVDFTSDDFQTTF